MIMKLLCWLGWHKWYTMVRCDKPNDHRCLRGNCDGCPYLTNIKTICIHCGKIKKEG